MDSVFGFHETALRVPFGWVDRYDCLWHGHALSCFEMARADLVRSFDLSASQFLEAGLVVPMVDLECQFHAPARDDEALVIESTLTRPELPVPQLTFFYRVRRVDGGKEVLRGRTRQQVIRKDGRVLVRLPPEIRARLERVWAYLDSCRRWEK